MAVPGIAVWHEPFYLKNGSWHVYFDVVNRLVLAALHGIGTTARVRRDLLWRFSDLVATSQYGQAALVIAAIEDFTKGPAVCFRTDDERMHRCRSILAEYGPESVGTRLGVSEQPEERAWGRLRKWGRLAEGLVWSRSTLNVPTFAAEDQRTEPRAAAPVYDVRSSDDGSTVRHRRSASTERRLWEQFVRAVRSLDISTSWADPMRDEIDDGWRRYWDERFPGTGEAADG